MKKHPTMPILVSPSGDIYRLDGTRLKSRVRPDGYSMISIYLGVIDGKRRYKHKLIHRLVLETYYGISDLDTRHLDGNKQNNKLENLKWGTKSENIRDQVLHGRHKPHRFKYNQDWLKSQILMYKNLGFTHRAISKELGVSKSRVGVISLMLKGY